MTEDTQNKAPARQSSGSVWPRLFNAVFLAVLVAGVLVLLETPAPQSKAPEQVIASERYGHVSRMVEEMEALIGQIEALSTGAPAPGSHP